VLADLCGGIVAQRVQANCGKSEHGGGMVEGQRRAREVRQPEYPESAQPANRRQKRRRK
jgi:hypothetical protein